MDIDMWVEKPPMRGSSGVSATETTDSTCGAFEPTVTNRSRRDGPIPTPAYDRVENSDSSLACA